MIMRRERIFIPGDRILARLSLNGRVVAEFVSDRLSDMSQLLNAVRGRTRTLRGLAQLYVRNLTRGWAEERPLMLYTAADGVGGVPAAALSESRGSVLALEEDVPERFTRWMMM